MEALGTAHEGRLTELHCVIAELSRKLHQRQQAAIMEEEAEADISGKQSHVNPQMPKLIQLAEFMLPEVYRENRVLRIHV